MRAIHADAVILGDRAPLRDGAILVDDRGGVHEVGAASEVLARHAGLAIERVRGVVMPGLVNAHTHVELSALRGRVRGGAGFVDWVERLIGARLELEADDEAGGISRAIDELDASGTAALGEVTNSLAAVPALARRGFAGVVFHEVFGIERASILRRVDGLRAELEEKVGAWPSSDLAYAPAPHTVYTTHPDAVRAIVEAARARGARTTLHLAEHAAERRALVHQDGPVVSWLTKRLKNADISRWPRLPPIAFAASLGAIAPHVLLVHLADATREELAFVAAHRAPVVLCPRSNLYIDVRLPPLIAMREAGIEAALGTDSLASNASLDVLAEARALGDRFAMVPASELLQMATWNGARALAREDLGRIAKGATPGLFAIEGDVGADAAAFVLKNVRAPRRWIARREASS